MKTIFVIFFLFAVLGNVFADGNATNTELVFQVQNSDPTKTVNFKYSSVSGTAILYETNSCSFSSVDNFSFTHNITGNNTTDDFFASIITDDSYPVELFEMVHALIKIDVIVNTVTKKTFYYDIRDCQYYTPCSGTTSSVDVTLRYDYDVNKLWFKKGVITSSINASASTGWEEISVSTPSTKTFWDVFDYEHCLITAPEKPSGLVASYSGIHPRLDWNANTESNLKWYNIYKKDATENFTLFTNTTNTYYIDGYEYKGKKQTPKCTFNIKLELLILVMKPRYPQILFKF